MRETILELAAEFQVLVQELRVVLVGIPARSPGLVEAETKAVRMNLLPHIRLPLRN
jgi:hypothetical protein